MLLLKTMLNKTENLPNVLLVHKLLVCVCTHTQNNSLQAVP